MSSHLDLSSPNPRENVSRILHLIDRVEPASYQFGKTKVSCIPYGYVTVSFLAFCGIQTI